LSVVANNHNTPKNAKNINLLKTKRMLNIKLSAKGETVFTFNLPGGAACPTAPINYATDYRQSRQFSLHGINVYGVYIKFSDNVHLSYVFLGFVRGNVSFRKIWYKYIIFYQKLLGGQRILCPPVQKFVDACPRPPLNSVPGTHQAFPGKCSNI